MRVDNRRHALLLYVKMSFLGAYLLHIDKVFVPLHGNNHIENIIS